MKRSTPRTITECSGSLFSFHFTHIFLTSVLRHKISNSLKMCTTINCIVWFYRTVWTHSNIKIVICLRHTTQFLLKNGMSNGNSKKKNSNSTNNNNNKILSIHVQDADNDSEFRWKRERNKRNKLNENGRPSELSFMVKRIPTQAQYI